MTETGIMLGIAYTSSAAAPARIVIAFVLSAGLLLMVLAHLLCGGRSGAQAEPQSAPDHPREWQWGWFVVFLFNLPLPLLFGFGMTSRAGTFGMLAGLGVVWLIGHRAVAHVREVRAPLMIGGVVVAFSQFLPLLQICAGALALVAVTSHDFDKVESAGDGFAVTVLTAALLAVVALVIGFGLCAAIWAADALERRVARNQQ